MASAEEQIKLILQVTDSGSVEEAIGKMARLRLGIQDTADTYAIADQRGDQFVVTTRDISSALDHQVAAAVEATARQKALNQVMSESVVQGGKFNNFMSEHKFRILEAGRAVQDFAQGGVAGILNNIERLVGGSGALAGVLTAVGVAAYVAWPYIQKWADSMGALGEKFKVPIAETDRLTEAIKTNKDELKKLAEQGELTYIELLKYSTLVGETTKMEEEQATKRAARAVKPGSSKKERARAAAAHETIAEDFGSSELLIESIMDTERGKQTGLKDVEYYVAKALSGMDVQSLGNLFPAFKERYAARSPERQEQVKQAQSSLKREGDVLEKRNKELDKAEKDEQKRADEEAKARGDYMRHQTSQFRQLRSDRRAQERKGRQEQTLENRQEVSKARQAADQAREMEVAAKRYAEDVEYWTKFNNGMINAQGQMDRATQILRRNAEDAQRRITAITRRNEESMVASQLDN